jgi:hypothetical protein
METSVTAGNGTVPRVQDGSFHIVGVGRSGTTLLRSMFDSHPRLAVPGESPWVTELAPDGTLDQIFAHPRWPAFHLDEGLARAAVAARNPQSWPELVDTLFSSFAEMTGKERWGEKTPSHIHHVERLAGWFPNARFIHIVRDGRAVAASIKDQPTGTRNAAAAAIYWRRTVREGRAVGERLGPGRYAEVRLEDLVADPERELRRLCAFLGEDYAPEMLTYPDRIDAFGVDLPYHFRHLRKSPTSGLRDWRAGLGPIERRGVEVVARPGLVEFGYAVDPPERGTWPLTIADRAVGMAVRVRRAFR